MNVVVIRIYPTQIIFGQKISKFQSRNFDRTFRHLMRHYVFCACSCNQTATPRQEDSRTHCKAAKPNMITENLIDSYVNQGATAFQQGQFQVAGKLFLAAYQKARSLDKSDPKLAVVYANLSLFYYQQKRYRKAEGLLEQSLAILTANGLLQTDFAEKVRVQLANIYLAQNKHIQLLKHYK